MEPIEELPVVAEFVKSHGGSKRILLAEDERGVRSLTKSTLERNGYQVWEACDGLDTIQVWQQQRGEFDLVITDVVMPNLKGPQLVERLLSSDRDLNVLYISGYVGDWLKQGGTDVFFLEKPFSSQDLLLKVQEILNPSPQRF